jgi:hypothetical protein
MTSFTLREGTVLLGKKNPEKAATVFLISEIGALPNLQKQ